jgi:hypothetical protein
MKANIKYEYGIKISMPTSTAPSLTAKDIFDIIVLYPCINYQCMQAIKLTMSIFFLFVVESIQHTVRLRFFFSTAKRGDLLIKGKLVLCRDVYRTEIN